MSFHGNLITVREADPVYVFHMLLCPTAEFHPRDRPVPFLIMGDVSTGFSEQSTVFSYLAGPKGSPTRKSPHLP